MIEYQIIYSSRKTLAIQIDTEKGLLVRAPYKTSKQTIERFIYEHRDWIAKKMARRAAIQANTEAVGMLTEQELNNLRKQAHEVLPARLKAWAQVVGVTYQSVSIRFQRTRWGSCSAKGTISLNALLMLTPSEVIDSVLVHELCHRKQMNHSARFYAEIYKVMPDYDQYDKWLKKNGSDIMARLPK